MLGPQFTYRMTAGSLVQPFFPGQPAYLSRDAALAYLGDFAGRPIQVQAGPLVRIRFDLTSYLPPASVPRQQITNVTAVLDEDNDVDGAPGSRLYGAAAIESGSKIVHQDLVGLAPNALYILTFSVVLNASQQKRFTVPFYTTESVIPMAVREIDTVLPITGGPITDSGPIGLELPLAVQYGGTGALDGNTALDILSNSQGGVTGALVRSTGGIWSVTATSGGGMGTITSVTAGTGLTGGGNTGGVSLSLVVPVTIANGGTGAGTGNAALDALSGASGTMAGHLERSALGVWSVTADLAIPIAVSSGGTGATTGFGALDSLAGVSSFNAGFLMRTSGGAWQLSSATMGTITGVTAGNGLTGGGTSGNVTLGLSAPVSIANGGTNATTAAGALTSLGAAPLASPTFTGIPSGPTAPTADNSTMLATTAFVKAQGYLSTSPTITLSGDISGSGTTGITTTLPNVNSNVGTFQGITVNAKGQVTAAANQNYLTGNQTITISGDISGSGATAITATLPNVNPNVGTFQGITVTAKGLVIGASNQNYAPLASPALTGAPTAPTPATADNSTAIATTAFVKAQGYAPLASPAFTGSPTAPTLAINSTGSNALLQVNAAGTSVQGILQFQNARGTLAAPTATQAGDVIGSINFTAYDGSAYGFGGAAQMRALNTWTTADHSSQWEVYTIQSGSTGGNYRMSVRLGLMILDGAGNLPPGGDLGAGTINAVGTIQANSTVPQFIAAAASGSDAHINLQSAHTYELCSQNTAISAGGFLIYDATVPATRIIIDASGNCSASTAWAVISDAGVKTEIEDHPRGLADVLKLQPRRFRYNGEHGFEAGAEGHGLIAQELAEVMPELVREMGVNYDGATVKTVTETGVIWPLINAIKELAWRLEVSEKKLAELEGRA